MNWNVEYTDEFEEWWNGLTEGEQEDFAAVVTLLTEHGPQLPYPYSSGIEGSKHGHMRELRVQSAESLSADFTPSIRGARQFCLSAAIRPETTAFTRRWFLSPTASMTTISRS